MGQLAGQDLVLLGCLGVLVLGGADRWGGLAHEEAEEEGLQLVGVWHAHKAVHNLPVTDREDTREGLDLSMYEARGGGKRIAAQPTSHGRKVDH